MSPAEYTKAGGHPPACLETDEPSTPGSIIPRLLKFIILLGLTLLFVYGMLPLLTESVPELGKMAGYLEENGIDPTRYFYTDVAQVKEAELYMDEVLRESDR